MSEDHKSKIARARLDALRRHPPSAWDETAVTDFNDILAALQAAEPDKDFAGFRVPPGELAPRATGFRRATHRASGRTFYSSTLYCESGRMVRRLEGVSAYLLAVDTPAPATSAAPVTPEESSVAALATSGRLKRACSAVGRFLWAQAQAIAPALVNAYLKRKGLE